MTNPNFTAVCLLIDRSGSMMANRDETEGAINAFIARQKEESSETQVRGVRLAEFDHQYDVVHALTDAPDLSDYTLTPRGMTALLDAMGAEIAAFGEELASMKEDDRPGHVVFAVMTDGIENHSREYTHEQIKKLVERQQAEFGWEFVYLGANQDAVVEGAKLGVRANSSVTYDVYAAGVTGQALGNYVTRSATGNSAGFTPGERRSAGGQK